MKKFDVKKAIEFCNGFKSCIDEERNIAYVVRMILKGGLVEDEAVKEDYKCPFSETTMCNENKRAGCEMRTEWFQNGGVGWETSSVKECEPDPILEVYDKFTKTNNLDFIT